MSVYDATVSAVELSLTQSHAPISATASRKDILRDTLPIILKCLLPREQNGVIRVNRQWRDLTYHVQKKEEQAKRQWCLQNFFNAYSDHTLWLLNESERFAPHLKMMVSCLAKEETPQDQLEMWTKEYEWLPKYIKPGTLITFQDDLKLIMNNSENYVFVNCILGAKFSDYEIFANVSEYEVFERFALDNGVFLIVTRDGYLFKCALNKSDLLHVIAAAETIEGEVILDIPLRDQAYVRSAAVCQNLLILSVKEADSDYPDSYRHSVIVIDLNTFKRTDIASFLDDCSLKASRSFCIMHDESNLTVMKVNKTHFNLLWKIEQGKNNSIKVFTILDVNISEYLVAIKIECYQRIFWRVLDINTGRYIVDCDTPLICQDLVFAIADNWVKVMHIPTNSKIGVFAYSHDLKAIEYYKDGLLFKFQSDGETEEAYYYRTVSRAEALAPVGQSESKENSAIDIQTEVQAQAVPSRSLSIGQRICNFLLCR